jgi:hypothetical protein
MRKFKYTETNGHDYCVKSRTMTGRLTQKRYEILRRYVRKYNRDNSALYGVSPNGYAYTCGCERDCCGCLTRTRMDVDFQNFGRYAIITLFVSESYNY